MKVLLSALLLLGAFSLPAQKYIYLKKGNDVPAMRIGINERVVFKTAESTKFMKGIMNDVTPSSITINYKTYALEDIEAFRGRNELLTIGGTALAGGALLYTSLGLINRLGSYDDGGFTSSQWITITSIFGAGLIMRWAGKRTYKKDKGWIWQVIDFSDVE